MSVACGSRASGLSASACMEHVCSTTLSLSCRRKSAHVFTVALSLRRLVFLKWFGPSIGHPHLRNYHRHVTSCHKHIACAPTMHATSHRCSHSSHHLRA